jgi:GGDEF domain-containing protein
VTVSIGAVICNGSNDVITENMLYHQADTALYNAKHNGRNQVNVTQWQKTDG